MGVAYNHNLHRWIYTSVVKHFKQVALNANIPMYLDRYDRDTNWAELRFSGPIIDELSRNCYSLRVNIDIMLTVYVNNNMYDMLKMTGIFAQGYKPICVYRYGNGPEDDQSLVEMLMLTSKDNNRINIMNFGLILPENKFQRSTIESDFEMYIG